MKPVKALQNISTDHSKAVPFLWIIYVSSVMFLLCFRACLFIDALWSLAGKGLTSWPLFVCIIVKLSLSHWYPGSLLYQLLIFALFLTFLMLTKLTGCRTSTFLFRSMCKSCHPWDRPFFWSQGHALNKLGRGSLDDATYIIPRL